MIYSDSSEYVFAHGKRPRGVGVWWFEVCGYDKDGHKWTQTRQERGKLSDAKLNAIRMFKFDTGVTALHIKVLP